MTGTKHTTNDPLKWSIRKLLTVSTEHICQSTADMLEAESLLDSGGPSGSLPIGVQLNVTVGRYGDFAWFLWVPFPEQGTIPADLTMIFEYARRHGCEYVLIDVDHDVLLDLPVYPRD